jgi:lipoprotein signal peptidase
VNDRNRHLAPLARIACLVAIGDFVTKEAAARWVALEPTAVTSWLHFAVVRNERGAFGVSFGAYTWQLNLALTLASILFVIPVSRDLARVDRAAPRALGLIVGGALGNLASLILSPRGVVDFIAVRLGPRTDLVLNVADVAAYVGLAMVLRTGFLIVNAMRRDARPRVHTHVSSVAPARLSVQQGELEVPRLVFEEPARTADGGRLTEIAMELPPAPALDAPATTADARVLEFPLFKAQQLPIEAPSSPAPDISPTVREPF